MLPHLFLPLCSGTEASGQSVADRAPESITTCLVQISGLDGAGNPVVQTIGYALDRPGLVLAPLHALERGGVRWETLQVGQDPGLPGARPFAVPLKVSAALARDPSRNLLLLKSPGLPSCGASPPVDDAPAPGAILTGFRERGGFHGRMFSATVDRSIRMPFGPSLLRLAVRGADTTGAGFLLDAEGRMVGSLLPSSSGADPGIAIALTFDAGALPSPDAQIDLPPRQVVRPSATSSFRATPTGLLARALGLTRREQAGEVIGLLEEVERRLGEFAGLLLERGAWRYRLGRTDLAIDDFTRAARATPGTHLAHYNLGIALGTAARYEAAARALERALEVDPRHALTRYNLALALIAAHQSAAARVHYEQLTALDSLLAADLRSLGGF